VRTLVPFIYNIIGAIDDASDCFLLCVNLWLVLTAEFIIAELHPQASGKQQHINPPLPTLLPEH
jgi:hypothetical protein